MTRDRDIKRLVRARMRATGERYTQAHSALFGSSISTPPRSGLEPDGGTMNTKQLLDALDRDGFAVLRDVVPKDAAITLARWVDAKVDEDVAWRLAESTRRRDAGESDIRAFPRGEEGRVHLSMEAARLAPFDAAVAELVTAIGTPRRGSSGVGACLPGFGGGDGLHQDLDGPAPAAGQWDGAILTFPLSDGWEGMRLVPGSHLVDPSFREAFAGAIAPHPDEVHVGAEPGDVVINSIHIWKSATLNRSTARRRELWVPYYDGEATRTRIKEYWERVEVVDFDAPLDRGNYVER